MTTSKSPLDLRIAIVGAGPAGLTTAIVLKKKGFKNVTLYERDAAADARLQGYSFMLFSPHGGLGFLEEMGLADEIEKISFNPQGFRFADFETGNTLMAFNPNSFSPSDNTKARRVMRAKLRKLLLDVAEREGVELIWNARILKCEQPLGSSVVNVSFENGSSSSFDLLIGADGGNSAIRKDLIGDELFYSGCNVFLGNTTRQACPEAFEGSWFNRSIGIGRGRGHTFFGVHHPPDEIFWAITTQVPKGTYSHLAGDKQRLKDEVVRIARSQKLMPFLRALVENGEVLTLIEYHDRPPRPISPVSGRITDRRDSRITLIGDAAHLMVPYRAQGGNNALLDAKSLTKMLCALADNHDDNKKPLGEDLVSLLSDYETEMIKRTSKEVLASRQAMYTAHEKNPVKIFLRNRLLGLIHFTANSTPLERFLAKSAVVGLLASIATVVYSQVTGTPVNELLSKTVGFFSSYFQRT